MPGIQDFTYFNIGKETTRGTPVAPTRQLYLEGTGNFEPDPALQLHEAENRGRRSELSRTPTAQAEDVRVKGRTAAGVGYDELPIWLSFLNGSAAFTGAGADKTISQTPAMTGSNAPPAYSVDVGDDVQNWRLQYFMASRVKVSWTKGGLTELDFDGFAQRAVKGAKAAPGTNAAVKIPG